MNGSVVWSVNGPAAAVRGAASLQMMEMAHVGKKRKNQRDWFRQNSGFQTKGGC